LELGNRTALLGELTRASIQTAATSRNLAKLMHNKAVYKKPHPPEKTRRVLRPPFCLAAARRDVWDEVKYCSNRCRKARSSEKPPAAASPE
jgi:hypothetical protein